MRTPFLLAAIALAAPSAAHACGGFFCNPNQPVDQAGEDVLFAVDQAAGTVEMHVKIEYQGPANEFAWVLPAPADPSLSIGTDALFPVLGSLRTRFTLNRDLGECEVDMVASSSATPQAGGTDAGGGVEVIRTGAVGPFETATLRAESSAELLAWLQTNGYQVPAGMDPLLAPYVAQDSYFVALRLQKDKDAGDVEPIVLTFAGSLASIPIQLTSVAATPDMRLRVYVAGDHRAVPQSYLHVHLNELAVDWWTGGANLDDAITRAADEAGGHAFYTDYSGPTEGLRDRVFQPDWDQLDWATFPNAHQLLWAVADNRIPVDDQLLGVLSAHLGLPEQNDPGLDLVDVLNCMNPGYYGWYGTGASDNCYESDLAPIAVDGAAFAADLEAGVFEPRRRANDLLHRWGTITRLTSSVSPAEMTVDPTFVFNPDLGPVSQDRFADELWFCLDGDLFDAPRELHLSDGREVSLPSVNRLAELGMTEFEWLEGEGLTVPTAAWIERTDETGPPEVVVDNRPALEEQLADHDEASKGCGCATTQGSAGWLALSGLALALRRRNRR